MRTKLIAVLVAGAFVAGCGGGSDALSDDGAASLGATVVALRAAAEAGDVERARSEIVALRTSVAALRSDGDISDDRAVEVLDAATEVESSLLLITTTTTTAPPDEDDDDDGRGKKRGKHDDD